MFLPDPCGLPQLGRGQAPPLQNTSFPVPHGLGTLKVGAPGDVVIFDTDAEWVVDPQAFASKGRNTPLSGCSLKGKVIATVVGGEVVYKDELALEKGIG